MAQDLAINDVFSADVPFPFGRADVFSDVRAAFDDYAPNRVAHATQQKSLTPSLAGLSA